MAIEECESDCVAKKSVVKEREGVALTDEGLLLFMDTLRGGEGGIIEGDGGLVQKGEAKKADVLEDCCKEEE